MVATQSRFLDPIEVRDIPLEDTVVKINRCAKVVKGGRRFSFSALCVLGNRSGIVGFGYAKAKEVPAALEKAVWDARKRLIRVPIVETTIPHEVLGTFRSSSVLLIPAAPGTGIIAGATVRAMVELAGVRDILTKVYGSTNPINVVQATFDAIRKIRTREEIARLRGVSL